MRPVPLRLKIELADDPYYGECARASSQCSGRITWEHAFIYAGKQINERWAIIPLCWFHHLGPGLYKALNQLLALSRATDDDLKKYPNVDWAKLKQRLERTVRTAVNP